MGLQRLRKSWLWCCTPPPPHPPQITEPEREKVGVGISSFEMSKRAIFLRVALAVSSLGLSLAVLLFFFVSPSVVATTLCYLNHSSSSLRGRLPHLLPLTLRFCFFLPFLLSGLKIGQLIIKQARFFSSFFLGNQL